MKTLHSSYYIICLVILLALIQGCNSLKYTDQTKIKPLPNSYQDLTDTINCANLSWRNYYQDSLLIQLVDTAIKNNYDLQIAFQRIEMAQAKVYFAKGLFFPGVSVNSNAGIQRFGKYTMDGAGNNGLIIYNNQPIPERLPDFNAGFQTSWELDIWGKLKNKKKVAIAQFLSSVEGKNWVITSLISDLATIYYDLIALDNELEIIKESIKLQDSALSIVVVQKQAGVANELAVKQFEAQLLSLKTMEIETQRKISECENNLNLLMGRFPQPVRRIKTDLFKSIPHIIEAGVPADLLKNRPDIKQAEFELIASKANLKAAKAAFFPSLNITGSFGYQSFKTSLLLLPQSMAYNVVGSLTAPLLNRSAIRAEFNTSKAMQLEALCNYQKSILNGYVEVYNQMVNYKSTQQILSLKTREVKMLDLAIKSSIELFKTGRANYLEVLSAQQNSLQSKIDLIEAHKQQYFSFIGIYKALGGGWR